MPGVDAWATPAASPPTGTLTAARPLAPALRKTFAPLAPPLEVLAPYATEADLLLDGLADAFSKGDANGRYLRILTVFAAAHQSVNRDPYPAPGPAGGEKAGAP